MIEYFDRCGYETPTALTDLLVGATGTNLVVIRHIDIEDQLSSLWLQRPGGKRLSVSRLHVSSRVIPCSK